VLYRDGKPGVGMVQDHQNVKLTISQHGNGGHCLLPAMLATTTSKMYNESLGKSPNFKTIGLGN